MALVGLLGNTLTGKAGSVETSSVSAEYVGIYFSAHWCPPCRGFTPKLAEFYNKFTKENPGKLEIVFVSSDRTDAEFDGYYADMPWLALPHSERGLKETLSGKYGVQGIPTLIFLKASDASVVCKEGRNAVTADPEGEDFPWSK